MIESEHKTDEFGRPWYRKIITIFGIKINVGLWKPNYSYICLKVFKRPEDKEVFYRLLDEFLKLHNVESIDPLDLIL